jgi:FkbM family methyltransferase
LAHSNSFATVGLFPSVRRDEFGAQMSMISYAQNREDVRLARAFRGSSKGFYVDVGAYDPVMLSMTKHFYDLGWHGLNLEAAPSAARRITAERERDTTVNVGVSNQDGALTFYEAPPEASGLSTLSAEEAAAGRRSGYQFKEYSIPSKTLAGLCSAHVTEPIDFMSVDVEGHELQVLEGADFAVFRPKVLVVEATRPLTQEPTHQSWEHIVLGAGYVFAVFDGLNRYYVANECSELVEPLLLPPNPFDEFVPYEYQSQIDALRHELAYYEGPRKLVRSLNSLAHKMTAFVARPFTR